MKKNLLAKSALLLSSVLCFSACDIVIGEPDGEEGTGEHKYTGDETIINISVYKAGYGQAWMDEACRLYEEAHPEYRFKIRANSRMFDTVKTELSTDHCAADVVLIAGYDYLNLATTGKLVEMSDLYNAEISDTHKKVKEVVDQEQYEFRKVGQEKDKIYGLPWQDSGACGIVYNKKIFRQYNLEVPTTMDEFFEVCETLSENNVTPLVYGGGQQDAYTSLFVPQWICQYYGYEYMHDTFENYASPEIYNTTMEGRIKAYQTLAKLFKGVSSKGKPFVMNGSKAFTAQAAQREFIFGNAAMDICGSWFRTEMSTLLKETPDFEFGYMALPHINADKKDYTGTDSSKVTYGLEANLFAVPETSKHKDVAKDFLVSMLTKESYTTYVTNCCGVGRPFAIDADETKIDDYCLGTYLPANESKKAGLLISEVPSAPIAHNGYLSVANVSGTDYYSEMINANSLQEALNIASTAASKDYQTAASFWDASANNWKEIYLNNY